MLLLLSLLLSLFAFSAELPGVELYSSPKVNLPQIESKPVEKEKATSVAAKNKTRKNTLSPSGERNIPIEYLKVKREVNQSELIQPTKGAFELFRGFKIGDIQEVRILHSVIAFSDEKAPVVGVIDDGAQKGLRFIGESYLEKNSKRIFIHFNRLIQNHQIFELKAVGVSTSGQPGLAGEYHSREAEYFTGDFISSFAAGYFDGLIPRRTNAFGQLEQDNSVDSAVKKGLASGSLSTADRFREKLKKAPEFSEIKGPFNLKILILDQAKSIN